MQSRFRKALATVFLLPAIASVAVIRLYQRTLSPDHGPMRHLYPHGCCRHEPTCSNYAIHALKTRSFPVAIFLTAKRIFRCNPWTRVSDEKMKSVIAKELQS